MNILFAAVTIDWTQIILAFMAMLGLWVPIWLNSRRAVTAAEDSKTTSKETHLAVNNRMDAFLKDLADKNAELLKAAVSEARAEGIKQTEDTVKAVALTVKNDVGHAHADPKATESLEKIEEHTEATAVNTARTDATVTDLKKQT